MEYHSRHFVIPDCLSMASQKKVIEICNGFLNNAHCNFDGGDCCMGEKTLVAQNDCASVKFWYTGDYDADHQCKCRDPDSPHYFVGLMKKGNP